MSHWILVNGKITPASLMEWARWFEDDKSRIIDVTDISSEPNYPGGDKVSTVFIGIDHNFNFDPAVEHIPILFETMVFGGEFSYRGWRYATLREAKLGHWKIVDCIRAGLPPGVEFGERPAIEEFLDM